MANHKFVGWLHKSVAIGALEVPRPALRELIAPTAEGDRLASVARLLADEQVDLADRVAGSLVLLYAQPVARVARLRWEDLGEQGGRVTLLLGREPALLPRPLGELVLRLRAERLGPAATAATACSAWLFAGKSSAS